MEETKSTDTEKLVDFFEKGAKFDILKGREAYFRAWDHQLIQEAYPFTVKAPGDAKSQWDILDLGPPVPAADQPLEVIRSEEHTSALQSLMRNSYAVFCLKKTQTPHPHRHPHPPHTPNP